MPISASVNEQAAMPLLAIRPYPRNPSELEGEIVDTTLKKSDRGLGVTIIGGENGEPLQIKSILHGGTRLKGLNN